MAYKQDTQGFMAAAIREGRSNELVKRFSDAKYMDKLQQFKKTLINNQNKLNNAYKKLNKNTIKLFEDSGGILDQIESIIAEYGLNNMESIELLREILQKDYMQDEFSQDELDFIELYIQTKLEFFNISDELQSDNANIIGTNPQNQYYCIFLDNIQGNDGEEFSKFMQLTRQQYDDFEKANPDLFTRRANGKYELKLGQVSVNDVYGRMQSMFGDVPDILDQVYAASSKQGKQYQLQTRTIYNFLKSNANTLVDKNNNILKDTVIKNSRQLELLFDKDLISNIQSLAMSSTKIKDNKLILDKTQVNNIFKTLDFNKYQHENLGGLVGGDLQFARNGEQYDYQIKYKGTNMPWNGRTYNGVINHINTYIQTGQKFMSDPTQLTNLAEGLMNEDQFLNYLDASPTAYTAMEEISYQTVVDSFMTEMDGLEIVIE